MTTRRKSPYLVLGLHVGATKDEAAKAFARATRRLRQLPDAPFDIEDLNWALHAVEHRADDPAASIDDFRMPANPSAYLPPAAAGGLLAPVGEAVNAETLRASVLQAVAAARTTKETKGAPLPALHRYTEKGS